ncbi:MAG: hypothetical protein ACOZCO_14940 [Bacteroidota bacterium]
MKNKLLILLFGISSFSALSQNDSLPPLLSSKHNLVMATFPTIETAFYYKHRIKKTWITAGIDFFTYRKPDALDIEFYYPFQLTDTTIIYRSDTDSNKSQVAYSIGIETKIRSFFERVKGRSVKITKAGIDFSLGKYETGYSYGEGYVKYIKDSAGTMYYLDENNNPVTNDDDAKTYTSFTAISDWKYRVYGATPYVSLDFTGKKLPLSFGIKLAYWFRYHQQTSAVLNDPLNRLPAQKENFWSHGWMMYLTAGVLF